MSKRFTDSEKWRDPWFSELSTELKLFWMYLLDNCDHAGIWKVNLKLAEFEMGIKGLLIENHERVPEEFDQRIESKNGYWFIPKFLKWQYGEKFNRGDAFSSALERIESKGFLESLMRVYGESLDSHERAKAKAKAKAKAILKKGIRKGTGGGEGENSSDLKENPSSPQIGAASPSSKKPLTDIQKVVTVFKLCQGVPREDKKWDKLYFSRFSRPAKELIEFLGDWRSAGDCVQDIYEKLTGKNLTVTMETVVKHASEWRNDKLEKESKYGVLPGKGDGNRPVNAGSN